MKYAMMMRKLGCFYPSVPLRACSYILEMDRVQGQARSGVRLDRHDLPLFLLFVCIKACSFARSSRRCVFLCGEKSNSTEMIVVVATKKGV